MAIANLDPVTLEQHQIGTAGEVLARAFHTNPVFVWGLPDERTRGRKLQWFMRTGAKIGHRFGEVHTTPGAVEGAAVWLPPGKTNLSIMQLLAAGYAAAPLRMGFGPFMKFMSGLTRFEELHKETVPGDHWYLSILGVDPPQQGQGIGSALIQPVLRKADDARLPCYLETDKPEDVKFYEKHGFVVQQKESVKGSPPFWTMLRPARG